MSADNYLLCRGYNGGYLVTQEFLSSGENYSDADQQFEEAKKLCRLSHYTEFFWSLTGAESFIDDAYTDGYFEHAPLFVNVYQEVKQADPELERLLAEEEEIERRTREEHALGMLPKLHDLLTTPTVFDKPADTEGYWWISISWDDNSDDVYAEQPTVDRCVIILNKYSGYSRVEINYTKFRPTSFY